MSLKPWLAALVILSAVLAGCASDESPEGETTQTNTSTTETETETQTQAPEAPQGTALSRADIAAIAAVFTDQPLSSSQSPWPAHLLKWVNAETFVLMHFDHDDPLQATKVLWTGIGVRGVFCEEARPGPEFTHFHRYDAPSYAEGHGGAPGEQGYWLLHVATHDFESPFGPTGGPGIHEQFGPTPPPSCDTVPDVAVPESGDGLDMLERRALDQVFDDEPLAGGQEPWPSHMLKWLNPDVFMLLHFDAADPVDADAMLWTGIGVRSVFCEEVQPTNFTHFHSAVAESYEAGHGGAPETPGYWLLHLATHDFESPFGPTGGPGLHEQFGPTVAPDCYEEPDGQNQIHEVRLVRTGDSSAPFAFEPASIDIAVGDSIRWVATENVYHTVTSSSSASSNQADGRFDQVLDEEGETFLYTFTEAGEHRYFCQPHAGFMVGTVNVA